MYRRLLIILLLLVLYAVLGFVAIKYTDRVVPDAAAHADEWTKVAGICLTLVTALMTALIALFNMAAQLSTAREIEALKPLLSLEYPAYKELNGAALTYRDALEKLGTGAFDPELANGAETKMRKARGAIFIMPRVYQDDWWEYWRIARAVKEGAEKALTGQTPFDQKRYWENHIGELGRSLEKLNSHTPKRIA